MFQKTIIILNSKEFIEITKQAERDFRELMDVPKSGLHYLALRDQQQRSQRVELIKPALVLDEISLNLLVLLLLAISLE